MSFSYQLKKILSYVYPIILEKILSKINGILELSLQNGKLVVDSEHANYSYGSLHDVFQQVISEFKFSSVNKKVLILGFGAGSIATILNKEKQLGLDIDGVDLDPVLLQIYKDHFAIKDSPCSLFEADAVDFLNNCNSKYDYIFIDVFVDINVPKELRTNQFIKLLQKVSSAHTQIAMNTMLPKDDDFVQTWMSSFGPHASLKRYHSDNLVLFRL